MSQHTTLKDVARALHVSVTTVSKALKGHPDISPQRRHQIMEAIEEMNYVPNLVAQNLRNSKSRFIAVIITDSTNPYFAPVIKQVEEMLFRNGYYALVFNNDENVQKELDLIREIRSIRVAGVILTPALGNTESVRLLERYKIPYVLAHRYLDKQNHNYVIADDEMVGYMATRHLLDRRKDAPVFFLNGSRAISTARDRFEGYARALREAGLPLLNEYLWEDVFTNERGYSMMHQIASMNVGRCSVLCYSDFIAFGVLKYLHENDIRVPDQVAVMGIDDVDMASYTYPELTTVHLPKKALGARCVELILDLIEGREEVERRIILPPELIVRESG